VNPVEEPYLNLLREIRHKGKRKPTRAKLASTGEHIHTLSLFGRQIRFDLTEGFPAVTTKKLAFKAVVHELLWFLHGDTDARTLQARGVHIWDQWADPETGDVGPVYGAQWRRWASPDGAHIDQIRDVISGIRAVKNDPFASCGRRLIVTAWNPADTHKMKLPSCHCFYQFSVDDEHLHCQVYMRSADAFLGVPFNIASYALLLHMVAMETGLHAGDLIFSFGDIHIYENHFDVVDEQLMREPFAPPHVCINKKPLFEIAAGDIALEQYQHHPALRGEVAV
jgi:thymidylate synthase